MAVAVRLARNAPAKTVHPLEGFGGQLNTDLFTTTGQPNGLADAHKAELGAAIVNLNPGHSRIFVQRSLRPETEQGRNAPEFKALMDTIALAHAAKANVNLTWWGQGPYGNEAKLSALRWPNRSIRDWPQQGKRKWPPELTDPEHPQALSAPRIMMQRFALVIAEAHKRKFTCVTHATIQNEPNGAGCDIAKQKDPGLSMRFYELLYRHFDAALRAIPDPNAPSRTMREAVRIVGGDLLERKKVPASHQDAWLRYMHANMAVPRPDLDPVVDGYSVHVYWEPDDGDEGFPTKLEARLEHLEQTIRNLPSKLPVYVTEYGVRKLKAKPRPGKLNGTRMEASPEAAFQHAWFNALAPQYGVAGIVKWALYRTDVNKGWGDWGMIDSPKAGLERFPVYRVTRLFNKLAGPGWKAAGIGRSGDVLACRFTAPGDAEESVVVLNNGTLRQDVRVQGLLRKSQRYFTVEWNADGKGNFSRPGPVNSDGGGTTTVSVGPQGLVAISTRQISL